jgi:hypothetical protein
MGSTVSTAGVEMGVTDGAGPGAAPPSGVVVGMGPGFSSFFFEAERSPTNMSSSMIPTLMGVSLSRSSASFLRTLRARPE